MVTRSSAVTKYAGAPYRKVEIMTWCVRFSFPCAHELARNRYIEHVTEATAAGRGEAGRGEAGDIRSSDCGAFRSWMPRGETRQRGATLTQHSAAQRAMQLFLVASSSLTPMPQLQLYRHRSYWSMVEPLTIRACTECFGTNLNLAASPPAAYTTSN